MAGDAARVVKLADELQREGRGKANNVPHLLAVLTAARPEASGIAGLVN